MRNRRSKWKPLVFSLSVAKTLVAVFECWPAQATEVKRSLALGQRDCENKNPLLFKCARERTGHGGGKGHRSERGQRVIFPHQLPLKTQTLKTS